GEPGPRADGGAACGADRGGTGRRLMDSSPSLRDREDRRPCYAMPGQPRSVSHWNTVSSGLPKTRAMRKATSSEGEYLPCSIAAIVWRVTPTRSPSSPCVISPARKRKVRMSLVKGGLAMPAPPVAGQDHQMMDRLGDHQREE